MWRLTRNIRLAAAFPRNFAAFTAGGFLVSRTSIVRPRPIGRKIELSIQKIVNVMDRVPTAQGKTGNLDFHFSRQEKQGSCKQILKIVLKF